MKKRMKNLGGGVKLCVNGRAPDLPSTPISQLEIASLRKSESQKVSQFGLGETQLTHRAIE